jgi:hypothetical protein
MVTTVSGPLIGLSFMSIHGTIYGVNVNYSIRGLPAWASLTLKFNRGACIRSHSGVLINFLISLRATKPLAKPAGSSAAFLGCNPSSHYGKVGTIKRGSWMISSYTHRPVKRGLF